MSTVHRTLDGDWAECVEANCELKFHFTDMTVPQLEALPWLPLLSLLNAMDPSPSKGQDKMWVQPYREGDIYLPAHREYDLPAIIWSDGGMEWWQEDRKHRDHGRPAIIASDGKQEWWVNGLRHRVGGPAVLYPNGETEYWREGDRTDEEGKPIDWNF